MGKQGRRTTTGPGGAERGGDVGPGEVLGHDSHRPLSSARPPDGTDGQRRLRAEVGVESKARPAATTSVPVSIRSSQARPGSRRGHPPTTSKAASTVVVRSSTPSPPVSTSTLVDRAPTVPTRHVPRRSGRQPPSRPPRRTPPVHQARRRDRGSGRSRQSRRRPPRPTSTQRRRTRGPAPPKRPRRPGRRRPARGDRSRTPRARPQALVESRRGAISRRRPGSPRSETLAPRLLRTRGRPIPGRSRSRRRWSRRRCEHPAADHQATAIEPAIEVLGMFVRRRRPPAAHRHRGVDLSPLVDADGREGARHRQSVNGNGKGLPGRATGLATSTAAQVESGRSHLHDVTVPEPGRRSNGHLLGKSSGAKVNGALASSSQVTGSTARIAQCGTPRQSRTPWYVEHVLHLVADGEVAVGVGDDVGTAVGAW